MSSPSVESRVISLKRSQKRFNDTKILTLKHQNMEIFHAIDYLNNPLFEQLRQKHKVNLTKTDDISKRVFSLPVQEVVKKSQLRRIVKIINKLFYD